MTAVGYISDTEEIIEESCLKCLHDGAAAFKLLERSRLPPTFSAKDLPGRQTQVLNAHHVKRIDHHLVEGDENSSPENISDTEHWLNWNGDLGKPHVSEDNWKADIESDIELDNGIADQERLEQRDVSATPNVPRVIWPTRKSKKKAEAGLVNVNAVEMRRNKGNKKR